MNTVKKKEQTLKRQMRTTSKILLGFLLAIFVGAGLLSLPIATVSGKTDFLTALFTATTSVCVTGLVVVQTFSHWTLFGKIVILGLSTMQGMVVFIKRVMKGTLAVEAVGAAYFIVFDYPWRTWFCCMVGHRRRTWKSTKTRDCEAGYLAQTEYAYEDHSCDDRFPDCVRHGNYIVV